MKHRIFTLMLALAMLLAAVPAAATETTGTTEPTAPQRAPGYCGETIAWDFSGGVLTITGTGEMDDFPEGAPWAEHQGEIEKVIISGGITYVGAYAFCDYDSLKTVEFGRDVYEIGERAFFSCDGLTVVHLPESFKIFGPSSFMGCTKLTEFHCAGGELTFKWNSMWDTYAKIYFPAERPWSVSYIRDMEEVFKGRIEFLASDGTDPYVPTESTEAPPETQAPTEAPTTVPPTEEPTQPPTTATTEPLLIMPSPTTAETQAPEREEIATETEPQPSTEPEPEESSGGSKVPIIILGSVAAFLILGSLIFGGGRKRGRYSR